MLPSEYYYMSGEPIYLNERLGTIYQPKIIDFIRSDFSVEDVIHVFCIGLNMIDIDSDAKMEEILKHLKDFDMFFVGDGFPFDNLIKSLKILYKTEDVYLNKKLQCILINETYLIDRENFTHLSNVVLNMLHMERPKRKKKERKYADNYRQKLWEKMQRYRQEKEEKEKLSVLDIVNVVVHHGTCVDYDKVFNLTYYQLVNTYLTLMGKSSYDEYTMYKTSGQFKLEQEVKHWGVTHKVKKGIAI